jgi:hypothetical protein
MPGYRGGDRTSGLARLAMIAKYTVADHPAKSDLGRGRGKWVGVFASTAAKLMVRPDRFELPTFWFVAMQHPSILLILMRAKAAFEANTWRIKAPVDERLMKGWTLFQKGS